MKRVSPSLSKFTAAPINENREVRYSEEDGIRFILEGRKGDTLSSITQGDFSKAPEHAKYADLTSRIWDYVLPIVQKLAEEN